MNRIRKSIGWIFFVGLLLITLVLCIALRQSQWVNAIFPGAGLYGTSADPKPIEMNLKTRSGHVTWRVPKAYLTFVPNWKGGEQKEIHVAAALYWASPEMPPWSTVKKIDGKPTADTELLIEIIGSGGFAVKPDWEQRYSSKLTVAGEEDDLVRYRYKQSPPPLTDVIFLPKEQPENPVYITCAANSLGNLLWCRAQTNLMADVVLDYHFSSLYLNRWQEIDARARALASSFLMTKTAN